MSTSPIIANARHNHTEGKDQPIKGMEVWVDIIQTATDMLECLSITELQQALSQDYCL